jgi:hypothetical protein
MTWCTPTRTEPRTAYFTSDQRKASLDGRADGRLSRDRSRGASSARADDVFPHPAQIGSACRHLQIFVTHFVTESW